MQPMTEPLARAEFDYGLDDLADVSERLANASPTIRRLRRRNAVVAGVIFGALFLGFGLAVTVHGSSALRAIAVVVAVLVGAIAASSARTRMPQVHRKIVREMLEERSHPKRTHCRVELFPDRALVTQRGLSLSYAWSDAREFRDDGGDLEMQFRGSILVVRRRAFRSAAERAAFLALAKRLASDASAKR
jgi:hypothetical protein